jgi:adenine phosphoribosyltransferase
MSMKELKKSLLEAPIVKKGTYSYVIHPLTDGIPEIQPALLREVTSAMNVIIEQWGDIDKIVTMEAMGIPLATALSLTLDIPFTIIRKRCYGLPRETSVEQVTGYSKSQLHINGLHKGDTIVIVDDVLSTGGTLRAVLSALRSIGVVIKGIIIAIDKGGAAENIQRETKIPLVTLCTIDVIDDKVTILKMGETISEGKHM